MLYQLFILTFLYLNLIATPQKDLLKYSSSCKLKDYSFKIAKILVSADEEKLVLNNANLPEIILYKSSDGFPLNKIDSNTNKICDTYPVINITDDKILIFITVADGKPQDNSLWLLLFNLKQNKILNLVRAGSTIDTTYTVKKNTRSFEIKLIHHWLQKTDGPEDAITASKLIEIKDDKIFVDWLKN